jgi:hypothetical protein
MVGKVACTFGLKTCASVGQVSDNAVDHREFPKQHLRSLQHPCAGKFAALLHTRSAQMLYQIGYMNWWLFNLNPSKKDALEKTLLTKKAAHLRLIEIQ